MQKPIYDILLEVIDDDDRYNLPKDWREKMTLLRDAEDLKVNAPYWEFLSMIVEDKIDAARIRELFPKAEERDIQMLLAYPTDEDARMEILATYREPTFAASLRDLTEQGEIDDYYTIKVTATTDKGKTVSESIDNRVTEFFVKATKTIALDLYEKILARHPNITESKAAVIMGGPSFERLLALRLGETP